ncbi:MAG: hypothetical protein M3Y91_12205 [Actinomycetota bacterium]|nr:hypothetical protein [Actinomycetota bacterium]
MFHRARRSSLAAVAAGVTVGVLGLVGCGASSGGGDNPAFGAAVTVGPASTTPTHPSVPVTVVSLDNVEYPQVSRTAKAPTINAELLGDARSLLSQRVACAVSVLRSDTAALSFRWTCANRGGLTATFDTQSGRAVTLADVLRPGYLPRLSATAVTQLEAGGSTPAAAQAAAAPTDRAFVDWAVDDQSLQVTFMVRAKPSTISFPLASLTSIIRPSGALGH